MWNIDMINTFPDAMDIGLTLDEATEVTPHRGPHPVVQLLSENLAATIEQAKVDNLDKSELTGTTPVESIPGASTASRSSRSTPSATMVPLARVNKLEAQMDTLLHHILPWIQSSIVEVEERIERKMAQHTKRQIMEIH